MYKRQAKKGSDGNWTYTVELTAHNSTGRSQLHVYGTKAGKQALIARTTANVAKLPDTKVRLVVDQLSCRLREIAAFRNIIKDPVIVIIYVHTCLL